MPNNNWQMFNPPIGLGNEPGWANVNIPVAEPAQQELNAFQEGGVVFEDHYNAPQALPQAPQEHIAALNQVLEGNPFNANAQMYYNAAYNAVYKDNDMFTKKSRTKPIPSASQLSDEYRALTYQITELKGSLARESEELASVLEKIATQVEVVRDIGSLIQGRISNLQKAANQLENWRQSLPQPDSPGPETTQPVGRYEPVQVGPPAQAGQVQVGPGLWQQDQV